jgi:hypothetical protein
VGPLSDFFTKGFSDMNDTTNSGFARMMAHAKSAKISARAITFSEAIAAAKDRDDVKSLDLRRD